MRISRTTTRHGLLGVFAGSVIGAALVATTPVPAAEALPAPSPSPPPPAPCTAAALAHTVSSVASAAGGYLDTHSGANDAITSAGTQTPDQAEASLQEYFKAHPGEYDELREIAKPLSDMRAQCNQSLTGGQISALVQVFNISDL